MKTNIIGRHQQIDDLESYIGSPKSEFVAIYGRRRVGLSEMCGGRLSAVG